MRETIKENELASQIKLIRKYLKLKIMEDNITFHGHNKERQHVYDLINRTIVQGESHSALMIGPRGCGKTTLVSSVLHQLSKECDIQNDALIIRLNGLIHHEEKIALKAITAQMQLENAVGDRVFGTFAENLSFLLSCLQSGADRKCKSMIFILEEFDMFCHSGRTQTLLYNLFDITHNKNSPMCVLGVTNRLDVMELLEKRVKSRFSHRHIFVFPNEQMDAGALVDVYAGKILRLLSVPESLGRREKKRKKSVVSMDTDDQSYLHAEILNKCNTTLPLTLDTSFIAQWNARVGSITNSDSVTDALHKFCYYSADEAVFRLILFQIVSKLSEKRPYIDASDFATTIDKTVTPEHRVKMLQSLSILELSLVIAMMHGMEIFDGQPMNFEMVLHRYTKFANTNSSTQSVPRPVILKAFEHLQSLEIIMPVRATDSIYSAIETTASRVQKEYKLYTLAVPLDDVKEAVKHFKALPTEIEHWFHNSVV